MKKRKCSLRGCRNEATIFPPSGLKAWCSRDCMNKYAVSVIKKEKQIRKVDQKKETRKKKQELKSMSTVCSEAQREVNKMIRAVDNYLGHKCIATGRPIHDAGHFFHAGSKYRISWLRFFHGNIHGQGLKSNRYGRGTEETLDYTQGLIDRYGESYLEDLKEFKRLEDNGLLPTPTREDIAAMVKWCRAMTRIYNKGVV